MIALCDNPRLGRTLPPVHLILEVAKKKNGEKDVIECSQDGG